MYPDVGDDLIVTEVQKIPPKGQMCLSDLCRFMI